MDPLSRQMEAAQSRYDREDDSEPETCPCGNPAKPGHLYCRECLAEIRAEQNGERI